jgi:uncharacterized membrane protein (DUF4010 family)
MYLRVLALVAIFRTRDAVRVAPALVVLALLSAGYGLWLNRDLTPPSPPAPSEEGILPAPQPGEEALHRNPLEINSALFFAFMFVLVSFATKYALIYFKELGLRAMSFLVGCSDITPFVVTVLQGNLGIGSGQILQAIIIATASNNLLKVFYTYLFGTRRTANLAAAGMAGLIVLSLVYALAAL